MGRVSTHAADRTAPIKFHLVRLRFFDGCYDEGGAYWGSPANVYRVRSTEPVVTEVLWGSRPPSEKYHVEFFVRANSRAEARRIVTGPRPDVRHYCEIGYVNAKFFN